jgi:hypothetical protein
MSYLTHFDTLNIKERLRSSNYWAHHNRNNYPLEIENLFTARPIIYNWIDCPCDENCECKNHGCKKHCVRVNSIFDDVFKAFLRCFVDTKKRNEVSNDLENNGSGQVSKRVKAVAPASLYFKENWNDYSEPDNLNLLCTKSLESYHKMTFSLSMDSNSIYQSKWFSILSMGTYVAFDSASVRLINKDYRNPENYFDWMKKLRGDLISHLSKHRITIDDFLCLDDPNEFYPEITAGSRRPLGNILDKIYLTL